jgi:AraC-like DNA-binding protein
MSSQGAPALDSSNERFAPFLDNWCHQYFHVDAHPVSRGEFLWNALKYDFGQLQLTQLACDPIRVERSSKDIRSDKTPSYFVTLQLKGNASIEQSGSGCDLSEGDFTLVDSRKPYQIKFNNPVKRLILRLPGDLLERRMATFGNPVANRFSSQSGMSAVFASMLEALAHQASTIGPDNEHVLLTSISDFLIASLEEDFRARRGEKHLTTHQFSQMTQIKRYINVHLSDPELSATKIANAFQITERHLYHIFKNTDQTLAKYIRQERIKHCMYDLSSPAKRARTVSEIGFSWGFNDAAHFSRTFKECVGVSPKSFRTRELAP